MASAPLRARAVDFLERVARGDVDAAFEAHIGDGFLHHNPAFAADADSLRAAMTEAARANPDLTLTVRRTLQEGDEVMVFSELRVRAGEPSMAAVHIVRFEAGRIVELWDVVQVPPEDTANELGMF